MECGICTGSCPISRELPDFSPRRIIKQAIGEPTESLMKSRELWSCLTCARCSVRCPAGIDFPEFMRSSRDKARSSGNLPIESHHGIFQAVTGLQTGDLKQKRTAWADNAGNYAKTGDYFFFVGCLPYFDVIFRYLDISSLDIARSVLTLLNALGITPVISDEERCCGHDALWSGDEETFRNLAAKNIETVRASGAKTVLFACPEGYATFTNHYTKYFGKLPFDVLHMTQFLARELPSSGLSFKPTNNGKVTFNDPCRLGRWTRNFDEPRNI